ncbi:MAG: yajC [Acidimicrobiales bacterium]|nr:yajC [Acidimicrobiales bacterium]
MASLLFLPLLVILYVVMVRPQQKRIRAQRALVATVDVGDEVITTAGLFGTITDLDDEVATLEIAEGVEVRIARAAIGRLASDIIDLRSSSDELEALDEADDADDDDDRDGAAGDRPGSSDEGPAIGGAA